TANQTARTISGTAPIARNGAIRRARDRVGMGRDMAARLATSSGCEAIQQIAMRFGYGLRAIASTSGFRPARTAVSSTRLVRSTKLRNGRKRRGVPKEKHV